MDPDAVRRQLILHAAARRQHIERAERETEALRDLARKAVAANMAKTEVSRIAQVSRPTLDAWLDD